jgi:hypothetical protein
MSAKRKSVTIKKPNGEVVPIGKLMGAVAKTLKDKQPSLLNTEGLAAVGSQQLLLQLEEVPEIKGLLMLKPEIANVFVYFFSAGLVTALTVKQSELTVEVMDVTDDESSITSSENSDRSIRPDDTRTADDVSNESNS